MTLTSPEKPENPEFLWVQLSEKAVAEFDGGRLAVAAEIWKSAHDIAGEFDEYDPRQASSLNNLAVALRINHDFVGAERIYHRALEKWKSASKWVDTMQLRQRARSSLFHLRLERKHREKYDNIARSKFRKLPLAGQAGTLNNLAELFHSTDRIDAAQQSYHKALRKRLDSTDEKEYGALIINTNLASLSEAINKSPATTFNAEQKSKGSNGFITRAPEQGWIVDKPAEFTDEGRLMAAVLLAHLIDHRRVRS